VAAPAWPGGTIKARAKEARHCTVLLTSRRCWGQVKQCITPIMIVPICAAQSWRKTLRARVIIVVFVVALAVRPPAFHAVTRRTPASGCWSTLALDPATRRGSGAVGGGLREFDSHSNVANRKDWLVRGLAVRDCRARIGAGKRRRCRSTRGGVATSRCRACAGQPGTGHFVSIHFKASRHPPAAVLDLLRPPRTRVESLLATALSE